MGATDGAALDGTLTGGLSRAQVWGDGDTCGAVMFSYVCLGTGDITRARAFWDAALAPLGIGRVAGYDDATSSAWGSADPGPHLWVTEPFDGHPAHPGNGTMVSFLAQTRAQVDAVHAAGIAAGGTDAGAPGLRPHYGPGFYAAYLRDPDGNKLNAVVYLDVAPG